MDFYNTLINSKIVSFFRRWNLLKLIIGSLDIFAIAFAFQSAFINQLL